MTVSTTVRISAPGDLAAAVPHLLGFEPAESLVIVTLRGRRRRIGLTLRFDLVEPAHDPELADEVARRLDARWRVLVVVVTAAADDGDRLPRRALVDALLDRIGAAVDEAILVRDGRWWCYRCPGEVGPVDAGSAVAQSVAAVMALRGDAVLPSRAAVVAAVAPVAGPAADAVAAAVRDLTPAVARQSAGDRLAGSRARLERLLDAYADPRAVPDTVAAASLIVSWHDVHCRDDALRRAVDPATEEAMRRLLVDLARLARPPFDAPVCTMLGFSAYADGGGVLAAAALDRARSTDPAYPLARLLADALDRQVDPRQLRTAWGRATTGSQRG